MTSLSNKLEAFEEIFQEKVWIFNFSSLLFPRLWRKLIYLIPLNDLSITSFSIVQIPSSLSQRSFSWFLLLELFHLSSPSGWWFHRFYLLILSRFQEFVSYYLNWSPSSFNSLIHFLKLLLVIFEVIILFLQHLRSNFLSKVNLL